MYQKIRFFSNFIHDANIYILKKIIVIAFAKLLINFTKSAGTLT
jgi:hypothetical protein